MKPAFTAQLPFLILSLLTGLTSSFISPVMSYFLVEGLQVEPFYIAVYTVSVTLTGLVVSQYMGYLADKGISAVSLYGLSMFSFAIAMLVFVIGESFWTVYFAGVVFMSIGAAAMPQMLTISVFWANSKQLNIATFNSGIRAAISFAWIVGPPMAFFLVGALGFSASFLASIACVAVAMLFVHFFIPAQAPIKTSQKSSEQPRLTSSFWFVSIAVLAGAASNIMYSSSMPLYLMTELDMPAYLPGLLMGLVAALEIPIMLLSARFSLYISREKLMTLAFVFSGSFYFAIFHATEIWQFISLQIINAIFYGLYAGLGLTLLQQQVPERTGFSSAFYSNSMKLGMMIGTTGTGLIAQFWSFRHASIGAGICALVGLAAMCAYLLKNKKSEAAITS